MSFHTGQSFTYGETPSATKWNYLWENDYALADGTGIEDDAIIARHISDGAITPEKLIAGAGTDWDWTPFTPSWANLTPGSGTNVGWYKQIGKTVFWHTRFVFGAGSSVGSDPAIVPPVAVSSDYSVSGTFSSIGNALVLDSGTANYTGGVSVNTSGNLQPFVHNAAATYTTANYLNTTTPMTWTTADELRTSGSYQAA